MSSAALLGPLPRPPLSPASPRVLLDQGASACRSSLQKQPAGAACRSSLQEQRSRRRRAAVRCGDLTGQPARSRRLRRRLLRRCLLPTAHRWGSAHKSAEWSAVRSLPTTMRGHRVELLSPTSAPTSVASRSVEEAAQCRALLWRVWASFWAGAIRRLWAQTIQHASATRLRSASCESLI